MATEYTAGVELAFGRECIDENVQFGLAVLQIPVLYYVLVATDSLKFLRKIASGLCSFGQRVCRRRQTGKQMAESDNPALDKITAETQQLIASYGCATGIVLLGSYYVYLTTVSHPNKFQFGTIPFVWRHYMIVLLVLEMTLFLILVALKCKRLSMRTMNVAFCCLIFLLSCLALPGMVDGNSMIAVSQFMFLFRLCFIPISGSTSLVFIGLAANHLCMIWSLDIYTQEARWYKGGTAKETYMALYAGVWYFDIAAALVCVLLHAWLQQALQQRVKRIMETTSLKTEAAASESMLATFCDAHCFLDANLCFERDERAVASLVFRSGNNAGTRFTSYIKTPEDEWRFQELTQRGQDGVTPLSMAQAINLSLRDGYDEQVSVELFHVLTRDGQGQTRHLIGLREYSQDAVPRTARSSAATAPTLGHLRSRTLQGDLESDATSQTGSSVTSDGSLKGKDEAFLLFDTVELEIMGASKRLMTKTGIEITDGTTFREFVAQKDEAPFLFQLVNHVTKATEEGTSQIFEMRLQMNMGNKRRGKARWCFHIQLQGQALLAKAVLKSLKPIQKTRRPKHQTPDGFLPIDEPLDAVAEMDRRPLMLGRNTSSQLSSPAIQSQGSGAGVDLGRWPSTSATPMTPTLSRNTATASKARWNL